MMFSLFKAKSRRAKHIRTIFLALFATATFVWAAINSFGVEPKLLFQFFIICVLGLGFIIVFALLVSLLRIGLQKLFSKKHEQ